jgi:hypothetical protein
MNFKNFLSIMGITTTGAWIALILILNQIDPTKSGALGFVLFYSVLSVALSGSCTLLGTIYRIWKFKECVVHRVVIDSLRHGILLSLLTIETLILVSQDLLRWWSLLLSVFIIGLLELLYQSRNLRI